jgi:hypothetical protein
VHRLKESTDYLACHGITTYLSACHLMVVSKGPREKDPKAGIIPVGIWLTNDNS